MPAPTTLPILDLDDVAGIAAFLLADPGRYLYRPPGQDAASGPVPVGVARVPARALRRSGGAEVEERVADEVPIAIEVDGSARLVVFATPTDLEDLVLGHLLGEGIVAGADELLAVETAAQGDGLVLRVGIGPAAAARLRAQPLPTDGRSAGDAGAMLAAADRSVVGRRIAPVVIEQAALVAGMRALAVGQGLWKSTGASHAAAWISPAGELLLVREDVGRRNALDKLVGAMARAGIDPSSGFAAVTSRVSHDLVRQAAAAGIGLLAAMSAPTALAIRVAQTAGMALVGFARGDSAALYTHPERVRQGAAAPADDGRRASAPAASGDAGDVAQVGRPDAALDLGEQRLVPAEHEHQPRRRRTSARPAGR